MDTMTTGPPLILGIGARTPLGFDRAASAAAVRCGISAIAEHPSMIDRFGMPMKVTRDAALDVALAGPERLAALTLAAAAEALAPLAGVPSLPPITIALSLGEQRPGQGPQTGAAVADAIRSRLDASLDPNRILHWMGGHAGGIMAMEAAGRLIASGRAGLVLAGGVDSYLAADTLEWLDETEQLHSDDNIYGFCPGEAAGFVLMAAPETARRLGLSPLLQVAGIGSGIETNLIRTEDIVLGDGLAEAFRGARAGLDPDRPVDQILCDMNGERYRGNEYGFAVLKSAGLFRDAADFIAPADCWGDVGAASGPLCVALVAEAVARGYSKGPLSLIWASSAAGQRAAAILRQPEDRR
ncbi:3-oxoacyl-[acyl-carrier-protein] synthase-1 [Paracoccus alcaliphilus]|uniref:3-oxoacyl-[acyl-carrier-protein] synthase-1 n=2 Tax=Paracoccus alcaliphilus TaxID=34002 RepID=A0A1H8EG15_9RHOB|nr:3-oxoacyl-[acyl-carrier-protein] synthase-1 [Paracoccus alcaliphilus]